MNIQQLVDDLQKEKQIRQSLEDKLESVSNDSYVQIKQELDQKSKVNHLMHRGLIYLMKECMSRLNEDD